MIRTLPEPSEEPTRSPLTVRRALIFCGYGFMALAALLLLRSMSLRESAFSADQQQARYRVKVVEFRAAAADFQTALKQLSSTSEGSFAALADTVARLNRVVTDRASWDALCTDSNAGSEILRLWPLFQESKLRLEKKNDPTQEVDRILFERAVQRMLRDTSQ